MPAHDPYSQTQEQSIKARKHQLYETDDTASQSGPRRSFEECLRQTPADPLSPTVKALLWVVGTLVIVLLLAAFARVATHHKPRPRRNPTTAIAPTLIPERSKIGEIGVKSVSVPNNTATKRRTRSRRHEAKIPMKYPDFAKYSCDFALHGSC